MTEKAFCVGLILGALGGALVVTNSHKARVMLKKGQEDLKDKISEFIDEKLEEKENEVKKQTSTMSKAKKA